MSTGFPHGNTILTNFVNIYTMRGRDNRILCQQAQRHAYGRALFEGIKMNSDEIWLIDTGIIQRGLPSSAYPKQKKKTPRPGPNRAQTAV